MQTGLKALWHPAILDCFQVTRTELAVVLRFSRGEPASPTLATADSLSCPRAGDKRENAPPDFERCAEYRLDTLLRQSCRWRKGMDAN